MFHWIRQAFSTVRTQIDLACKVERVVLNALGKQMRLCCLVSAAFGGWSWNRLQSPSPRLRHAQAKSRSTSRPGTREVRSRVLALTNPLNATDEAAASVAASVSVCVSVSPLASASASEAVLVSALE